MPIHGRMLQLKTGNGYFVEGGKKGILVLHGWWGLSDFVKRWSDSLSKDGFSVLALDLYHGQVANDIESAKQWRGSVDRQAAHDEIRSAVSFLRESGEARIGVIGFSIGANYALWTMDNCYKEVGATVLYYGTSGGRFRKATSRVLGHFADDDPYERPEKISALQGRLEAEPIPTRFHIYPNTKHWFAEDDRPEYEAKAAQLAWKRTIDFLRASLQKSHLHCTDRSAVYVSS